MAASLRSIVLGVYRSSPVQAAIHAGVVITGRDRRRVRDYVRKNAVRKLQIGSGSNNRPGWVNTNWYPIRPIFSHSIFLDAAKPFPLPSDTFDYIFSEHMIEHVPYLGGANMLRECFRVLKPGGRLRVATPDFDFLLRLLKADCGELEKNYVSWAGDLFLPADQPRTALGVVNNFVRDWGHTFIYDRACLEELLHKAGFQDITPVAINESAAAELRDIDSPQRMPDGFLQLESMTYEAVKPG